MIQQNRQKDTEKIENALVRVFLRGSVAKKNYPTALISSAEIVLAA